MTNFHKQALLIIALIFVSNFGFSQSNEIKIKFIGNCGLYMSDGNLNIYVDFPYKSGAYKYMEYSESELDSIKDNSIFIFTHRHADHYSKKRVRKIKKQRNGNVYGSWNVEKFEELNKSIPNFSIQSFKTKHRFALKHYSYLITWHGKKLYFSGDTEHAETIGTVSNIDYAFVPYWLLYDAKEKDIKIDTKVKVLYHLYPNQKIEGEIPEDMIILDKQGEIIAIQY